MVKFIENLEGLVAKINAGENIVYVGDRPYSIRDVYAPDAIRAQNGLSIFAEDDCGNWIAEMDDSGNILFIDHETDSRIALAEDFPSLLSSLTTLRDSDVIEPKVVSAWIDPDFARDLKNKGKQ